MFLAGAPFTVAIIQIPLRFQTVNGVSTLGAGVRLLPFALASPIGSVLAAGIAGKAKIPPIYFILLGAISQVVGFSLLSTAPTTKKINQAQYGYQAIAGFGCGVSLVSAIVMTPFSVEKHDKCLFSNTYLRFFSEKLASNQISKLIGDSFSRCRERHDSVPYHGWGHRSCNRHHRLK